MIIYTRQFVDSSCSLSSILKSDSSQRIHNSRGSLVDPWKEIDMGMEQLLRVVEMLPHGDKSHVVSNFGRASATDSQGIHNNNILLTGASLHSPSSTRQPPSWYASARGANTVTLLLLKEYL